jgi:hypothetical protein
LPHPCHRHGNLGAVEFVEELAELLDDGLSISDTPSASITTASAVR